MSKHDDLATAIEKGNADEVEQLLVQHPDLVNSRDWTSPPLHCAVLWNQLRIADMLLANGADIEIRDPDHKTTPLRYAIVYCRKEMIRLLISRGANTGALIENGTTAIQLATDAANGKFEELGHMPSRTEYREIVDLLKQPGVQ